MQLTVQYLAPVLVGVVLVGSCDQPGDPTPIPLAGDDPMEGTMEVRHVSVSIERAPDDVYRFASDPQNLARWATGLAGSIRNVGGEWVVEGGPLGRVAVRFTEPNALGVLDHDVELASDVTVHNPLRVIPNGTGSEIVFSLFRRPGTSAEAFEEDAQAVEKDLRILKGILEGGEGAQRDAPDSERQQR
jgi:hypothetical protein